MTVAMTKCRCPKCGHIRGEAADGSRVRLQCRQDGIMFVGMVSNGKFVVTSTIKKARSGRQLRTGSPPGFIG